MHVITCWAIPFTLLAMLAPRSPAQNTAEGSDLRVYHVAIGPGAVFYERFGHNVIWIHDPAYVEDAAYNYGVFDFEQDNFTWRFIQGRMLYRMEAFIADEMMRAYAQYDGRSVYVQELNLTAAQKRQLQDFLNWNVLPQNKTYRYDYYRDNCSTRVRDALDRALGGQLRAQTELINTGVSYRWHTRRLSADEPWLYVVLQYLLGHPVDRPINGWEAMFLPLQMRERLRAVRVVDEQGQRVPLVKSEWTYFENPRLVERSAPPRWLAWFLLVGLGWGGALLALAWKSELGRWRRRAVALVGGLWALLAGVAGAIVTWGWLFTDHTAGRPNENILQLSPLAVPLVVLVPMVALGYRRGGRAAMWLAAACAALSLAGFALQALPAMKQVNGEIIALALPINLALAWVMWRAARGVNGAAS